MKADCAFCLRFTGKDATSDFEDTGHSDEARDMMGRFCIGEIDRATVPLKRLYNPPQSSYKLNETSDAVTKILQFLVPLFILVLVYAVRQYTREE